MLQWLEAANLFVVGLDREGVWFRYHSLFREVLQHRLRTARSEPEIAALHTRAGCWLAEDGQIDEALEHLLAAGAADEAVEVVVRARDQAIDEERWHDLQRWLRVLPAAAVESSPHLLVSEAWLYHRRMRWSDQDRAIRQARPLLENLPPSEGRDLLQSEADALQAQVCYWRGDGHGAVAAARRVLDRPGKTRLWARGVAQTFLAGGLQLLGDVAAARASYQRELESTAAAISFRGIVGLALLDLICGDLTAALQTAGRIMGEWGDGRSQDGSAWGHLVHGIVSYQRNELDAAEEHFAATVADPLRMVLPPAKEALIGLASVEHARGRVEEADRTLARLLELAAMLADPALALEARVVETRFRLLSGRRVAVADWLADFGEPPYVDGLRVVYELPPLTLALALIVGGSGDSVARVDALLARLHATARSQSNIFRQIQVGTLTAALRLRQGDVDAARGLLSEAVELGRSGGFVRPFVDAGLGLRPLLDSMAAAMPDDEHLARILGGMGSRAAGGAGIVERAPRTPVLGPTPAVVYLPTNRELEVLSLLDQRLSNKEIARRLVLSPATVKRHSLSIYRKLGVGGRREASIRARELGVLPLP